MHDLYFFEEQYDDYEYERPFWVETAHEHPIRDESAEAKRLTLIGKVIVMAYDGRDHLIEQVCDSLEEAREAVAQIIEETAHGLDVGIYQVPASQPQQPELVKDFDDAIPF